MIISKINISNFGGLQNVHIPRITDRINLFFGYNEAGKSTVLNFIKYILFNMKYPDSLNRAKPEGDIVFSEKDIPYKLLRSGKKSKQLINLETGEDITDILEKFIIIDSTIFSNVFGMGVDDIARIDKSGKAQINAIIADSAFNIGHKKPQDAIEEIKKEYEIYWKPRAKCKIRDIIKNIKEKSDLLEKNSEKAEKYNLLMKKDKELKIKLQENKIAQAKKEKTYENLSKRLELKKALIKIESIDIDSKRYDKITEGDNKLLENSFALSKEKSEKIKSIDGNINKLSIAIDGYDTEKFAVLKQEDSFFKNFYLKFKENSNLDNLIDKQEKLTVAIDRWIEQNTKKNTTREKIYNISSAPFSSINDEIGKIKPKLDDLNSIDSFIESNNIDINRNNKKLENLKDKLKNFKLKGEDAQKIEKLLSNMDNIENRLGNLKLMQIEKIDLDENTIEDILSTIDKLFAEQEKIEIAEISINRLEEEMGIKTSLTESYENIDEDTINEFAKKKNRIDELSNFNVEELKTELSDAHNNLEKNDSILTRIKYLQEKKRYEKETDDIMHNLFYSAIGDIKQIKEALNKLMNKNIKKAGNSLFRWNLFSYAGAIAAILSFAAYLYFGNISFAATGFLFVVLFIISFYFRGKCSKSLILRDNVYKDFNVKEDVNIFDNFFMQQLQKIEKNRQIIEELGIKMGNLNENTDIEEINNAVITAKMTIKETQNRLKTRDQSMQDSDLLMEDLKKYLNNHNVTVTDEHKLARKIYKLNKLNTILNEYRDTKNSINSMNEKIKNSVGDYYDEDIQKLKVILKNMLKETATYESRQKEMETLNKSLKQYSSELQNIFNAFGLKNRHEYSDYMQNYNELQQNIDKISDSIKDNEDKSRKFEEKRLNLEQIIDKYKNDLKNLCDAHIQPLKIDYDNMEISKKVIDEYINDIVPKLDDLNDIKNRVEKIKENRKHLIDQFSIFLKQYFPQRILCSDFESCRQETEIILEKLKELKEEKRRFEEEKNKLQMFENSKKESENELKTLKKQITGILQKAKASNEFEFRSKYDKEMENRKNISIKNRMINDLNLSRNYDDAKLELAEDTQETLEYKINNIQNEIDKTGDETVQAEKELSSCETEIKNLIDIEETERLNSEIEALKKQLKEMVYEQDVKNIAMAILKNAQKEYVEKSQPRILKTASEFLSRLTGGRYSQIIFETQKDIFAKDEKDGLRKDLSRLSKGTLQQMFFAIRIAVAIDRNSKLDVSYPVIFDDVFVNFDEYRMKNAISMLFEIAEKHNMQFLIFTCHKFIHNMISNIGKVNDIPLEA